MRWTSSSSLPLIMISTGWLTSIWLTSLTLLLSPCPPKQTICILPASLEMSLAHNITQILVESERVHVWKSKTVLKVLFCFYPSPNLLLDAQVMYFVCEFFLMRTTTLLWCSQGTAGRQLEASLLTGADANQIPGERLRGLRALPLGAAAVKSRPWAQPELLCSCVGNHINA